MEDLTAAIILMAVLSIAIFFSFRMALSNAPERLLDGIAAVLVILVGVYVRLVWGQLWIVRWIPFSSVIILSNWFPLILAALASVLWLRTKTQSILRRLPVQSLLIAGAIWSVVYVIPDKPPACGNSWIEPSPFVRYRICRQTTQHTCSAAAAATILNALGIEASEAELAALCLTKQGTTWLGLYHGLAVKLRGTGFRAEFFECRTSELPEIVSEFPALLCCELSDAVDAEYPHYYAIDGWRPGVKHSTVLFETADGRHLIGDPSQIEPEIWTDADMDNLWTGKGLRIVQEKHDN
ncbi:MAG: cysteine peptidase family C39 domain-containing protein [Planctomycetales bacterium]|jgi:hypothetical protein|nr:cysteine peptidase family C39 domain-containing protein [Planctomycetales bacterium]